MVVYPIAGPGAVYECRGLLVPAVPKASAGMAPSVLRPVVTGTAACRTSLQLPAGGPSLSTFLPTVCRVMGEVEG